MKTHPRNLSNEKKQKQKKLFASFDKATTKNGAGDAELQDRRNQEAPHVAGAKPSIGIDKKKLDRVSRILNNILSNQHVLYLKTRNFHWNLVGKRFHPLHAFLEEQYKMLELSIDETAERVRTMGGVPHACMTEFLQACTLQEETGRLIEGDEAINLLLKDHEKACQQLRNAIKEVEDKIEDAGTADFLTDQMKIHEKTAWMLRSHLA